MLHGVARAVELGGIQSDRPQICVAAMFCGQLLARQCVCGSGRCTQHSDCWPCQCCEGVRICGVEVQCHSFLARHYKEVSGELPVPAYLIAGKELSSRLGGAGWGSTDDLNILEEV